MSDLVNIRWPSNFSHTSRLCTSRDADEQSEARKMASAVIQSAGAEVT